jgi:hypothetical protein
MTTKTRWLGILIALSGVAAHINATPLPGIDTTIERKVTVIPGSPGQRLIYTLHGKDWPGEVMWSLVLFNGNDTLFVRKGKSDWFDSHLQDPSEGREYLDRKKKWYCAEIVQVTFDSVHSAESRRREIEKYGRPATLAYYRELGHSMLDARKRVDRLWQHYRGKLIIGFAFSETPEGSDETLYIYDPGTRKLVPAYRP